MTTAVHKREELGLWALIVIPITLGVTDWFLWTYVFGAMLFPNYYVTCSGNTCGGGLGPPPPGAAFIANVLEFGVPLLASIVLLVMFIRSARGSRSGRQIGGR